MNSVLKIRSQDHILLVGEKNVSFKLVLEKKNVRITLVDTRSITEVVGKFDAIVVAPNEETFSSDVIFVFLKLLNPGSHLLFYADTNFVRSNKLEQVLLISGFLNIVVRDPAMIKWHIVDDIVETEFSKSSLEIKCVKCEKPNYEIGSAKTIALSNIYEESVNNVATAWKLGNTDDYIEDNDLLSEEDMKKPDASSLKVCGTTGKRKACKDCSCGLAEELENEKTAKQKDTLNVKSSCGSCYLGDAFRCASCPYLGMPAFKPGEKIQLSDQFLSPDI